MSGSHCWSFSPPTCLTGTCGDAEWPTLVLLSLSELIDMPDHRRHRWTGWLSFSAALALMRLIPSPWTDGSLAPLCLWCDHMIYQTAGTGSALWRGEVKAHLGGNAVHLEAGSITFCNKRTSLCGSSVLLKLLKCKWSVTFLPPQVELVTFLLVFSALFCAPCASAIWHASQS